MANSAAPQASGLTSLHRKIKALDGRGGVATKTPLGSTADRSIASSLQSISALVETAYAGVARNVLHLTEALADARADLSRGRK